MEIISVRKEDASIEAAFDTLSGTASVETVVCAGDTIEADREDGLLRGHGTQPDDDNLRATQCGVVFRVNKLISVQTLRQRYTAELGDAVVGRIVEVSGKRWRLDLQSRQEAAILLSAITLPGGVQRRRTVEDELNMRSVYEEGDLISAEVQRSATATDGVLLHTRNEKYGKLSNGQLISVPPALVPRQKQHFATIADSGVAVILGVNGLIWIGIDQSELAVQMDKGGQASAHERIARVANGIRVLAKLNFTLTAARISSVYKESLNSDTALHAMLHQAFLLSVIKMELKERVATIDV